MHDRRRHTTSAGRNTHTTHNGTPPTARITYETRITTPHTPATLHHNTTSNTHTSETNNVHKIYYTTDVDTNPSTINDGKIKTNMRHIHTTMVNTCFNDRQHNKVTSTMPLSVRYSGTALPGTALAQLGTGRCPQPLLYLGVIDGTHRHCTPL